MLSTEGSYAPVAISLEALAADPYPIFADLRSANPIAWVPQLGIWMVTRYDLARQIMLDADRFKTGTEHSLLFETFGEHMLTTDGPDHRRYRNLQVQKTFSPAEIRRELEAKVQTLVAGLVSPITRDGKIEVRSALASRLPILVMLELFGLPLSDEGMFRRWYDSFEQALANLKKDQKVLESAAANMAELRGYFAARLAELSTGPSGAGLLGTFQSPEVRPLSDEEVIRNLSITFFGGISTVEAMILNTIWALFQHPAALDRVCNNADLIDRAIDETMRWEAPVQTAVRHTLEEVDFAGVRFPKGSTVACMLGAANRDPAVFEQPDVFDLDRTNASKHLGFAIGAHLCLGRHLARLEAGVAVKAVLGLGRNLRLVENVAPYGHEFRQPAALNLAWDE